MKPRFLIAFLVIGTAAIYAALPTSAEVGKSADGDSQSVAASPDDAARYMIHMVFRKDEKTISCPTVKTIARQPATVQTGSVRPFVIGIDKAGEAIVQNVEEGIVANLTVTECRDGIVTLDMTLSVSRIRDVGRRGAVQTVKTTTQQIRLIEPVLVGGTITAEFADGTEVTATLEKSEAE